MISIFQHVEFFYYEPDYIIEQKNINKMFIKITFQIGVGNNDIDKLSILTQIETQLKKNQFISKIYKNENINMNEKKRFFS